MKYYTYHINKGWTTVDATTEPQQVSAGYINTDGQVALDLWIEIINGITNDKKNAISISIQQNQNEWNNYIIKLYAELPSYVQYKQQPPTQDDNGVSWNEYLPRKATGASYYLNIRSASLNDILQIQKVNNNNKIITKQGVELKLSWSSYYKKTYYWIDSKGVKHAEVKYDSDSSTQLARPVDTGYPDYGYTFIWNLIDRSNMEYEGEYTPKAKFYQIIHAVEGIGENSPALPQEKNYKEQIEFSQPETIVSNRYKYLFEGIYVQYTNDDAEELVSNTHTYKYHDFIWPSNTSLGQQNSPITFRIKYKKIPSFTITYNLPQDVTTQTGISLEKNIALAPEFYLGDIHVLYNGIQNTSWLYNYTSYNQVTVTPVWDITIQVKEVEREGNHQQTIKVSSPTEPFYLSANHSKTNERIYLYEQSSTEKFSPFFPYTLYDFQLSNEGTNPIVINMKLVYFTDRYAQEPWPYFIYDQYGRPVPIYDIIQIQKGGKD